MRMFLPHRLDLELARYIKEKLLPKKKQFLFMQKYDRSCLLKACQNERLDLAEQFIRKEPIVGMLAAVDKL